MLAGAIETGSAMTTPPFPSAVKDVMMASRLWIVLLLLPTVSLAGDDTTPANDGLAREVGRILRRNCARCHKGQGSESGYAFNIMNVASLTDEGMLVAEDPESSEVFNAMFGGRMPPRNRPQLPRPSPEEVEVVRKWIAAGAPVIPAPQPRPPLGLKQELEQILRHLQSAPRDTRHNLRYFSLTHLYNDPTVDDEQLQVTRMALAKALNSLSWEPEFVIPQAVNREQTLYAVDIARLGWDHTHWLALSRKYPYAVSYSSLDDVEPGEIAADINSVRAGDRTPVVIRADWLNAVATKPPLYYTLLFDLELPELRHRQPDSRDPANPLRMTDLDLERYLQVNVAQGILRGTAQRAGYTESGVSGQNRLIERHLTRSGNYYWKSYDFKSSNRTAILTEFPLGPKFNGNTYNDLSFDHDGGEIIFRLANGLQGYLLVDAKGNRIDAGPIEVVGDSLKTSGNEQIVAGVSCIACHRTGMIESPDDEVRPFTGVLGDARLHVRRLYPENEVFRTLVDRDRQQFLAALNQSLAPFLKGDSAESLPEPVAESARHYHLEPMTLQTVAAELFITPERLKAALAADPVLRRLGLRVLLREGGTIKRAAWENPAAFPLMKQTARQFGFDPS